MIVILVLAVTSCLVTPAPPTGDGQEAGSGPADGTPAGGDLEPIEATGPDRGSDAGSAGDAESAGTPEPGSDLGTLFAGVIPDPEGTSSPRTVTPADASPRPDEIPLRVLAAGSQSAVRVPVAVTIESQAGLEEVWSAIHANQLSPPEAPEVDFGSETVIVLILGERSSAGYSVRAARIALQNNAVDVRVEVTRPGPDVMTATVLTSPFELSTIQITGVPVTFIGDDLRDGYDEW